MKNKKEQKKKILILGGTMASYDVVETSKRLDYYTIVIDDRADSPSKLIADESHLISTTDYKQISDLIKEESIDGIFTGPGEFNLINSCKVALANELPFYFDLDQWEICSNKSKFKNLLREFDINTIKEYLPDYFRNNEVHNSVIVKPVDGSSSHGITICNLSEQISDAVFFARSFSKSKEVIIEEYIENEGLGIDSRYIYEEGNFKLLMVGDRYIVDPYEKTSNICHLAIFPSKYTKLYLKEYNEKFIRMFKSIGLKTGVLFIQGLPKNNKIYFHEMGLRISGGNIYKINESANSINELEMIIKHQVGDKFTGESDFSRVDPYLKNQTYLSFHIPLKEGEIFDVSGIEDIKNHLNVIDYLQYYNVGDTVKKEYIGTLSQLFCRIKILVNSDEETRNAVEYVQKKLKIKDISLNDMIYKYFDTNRI